SQSDFDPMMRPTRGGGAGVFISWSRERSVAMVSSKAWRRRSRLIAGGHARDPGLKGDAPVHQALDVADESLGRELHILAKEEEFITRDDNATEGGFLDAGEDRHVRLGEARVVQVT